MGKSTYVAAVVNQIEGQGNKYYLNDVVDANGFKFKVSKDATSSYQAGSQAAESNPLDGELVTSSEERLPQDFAEGKDNFAETDGETQEVYRASAETAEAAGMKTEELQGMTDEVLRQVPELMENPVIIMESKTQPNRITLLGEAYAENGIPVFGVVELMPISRNGKKIDAYKIASVYTLVNAAGNSTTQSMINTSRILYIEPDKKRTDNWLSRNRLQLPLGTNQYGSIGRITLVERDVNKNFSAGKEKKELQDWQKKLLSMESNEKEMLIQEANKATKTIEEAETGKEATIEVFHGRGKTRGEIYTNNQFPVAGEGKYYAVSERAAKIYGDEIEAGTVTVNKPLVIRDDSEWSALIKRAGNKYANPKYMEEAEARAFTESVRKQVLQEGYIVSAYMQKNNAGNERASNAEAKDGTSKTGRTQIPATANVAQESAESNNNLLDTLFGVEDTEAEETAADREAEEGNAALKELPVTGEFPKNPMDLYNSQIPVTTEKGQGRG